MTRCDYDVVFYRVFCVTLLAIAFTFTIILTNVFIDIDGLLAKTEDKYRSNDRIQLDPLTEDITSEPNNDDMSYGDTDDSFRTKRSIETQNFLFHIKNPKIKNILTSRLESLLEALDAGEPSQVAKTEKATEKDEIKDVVPEELTIVGDRKVQDENDKKQKDENMLHLTMHNVLLQGIIGHMDLNEVYKRVNSLMKDLHVERREQKVNAKSEETSIKHQPAETKPIPKLSLDDRLVSELIKCNDLQDQILSNTVKKIAKIESLNEQKLELIEQPDGNRQGPGEQLESETVSAKITSQSTTPANPEISIKTKLGQNLLIKTTVDIRSIDNERNDTISKENIQGIVDVIYNGKSIKFIRPDIEETALLKNIATDIAPLKLLKSKIDKVPIESASKLNAVEDFITPKKIPNIYLNKFISDYFKHISNENKDLAEESKEGIETKRLKRHVKIKFNKDKKGTHVIQQEKAPMKKDTEDDELYVEIETHFDSKGMKGERKKKLIRSLIDKIQKAIHSEENKKEEHEIKKLKPKPLHVKKRLQNPLEARNPGLNNKYMVPVSNIVHRQLNPITATQDFPNSENTAPNVKDRSGEAWKKEFLGPTFLTATKSINSAEMSEVEVDYNRVLDVNGIPQRLQQPLNTDMSNEIEKPNSYFDLGNMKFFIKDVDGSGFSVGFNQYVDEPPDAETMKLFTGLENVIKTYHQDVDQEQDGAHDINLELHNNQDTSTTKNNHIMVRRSVNHQHDYHSNEYKIIYDSNFMPFNSYKDIYERDNSKPNIDYNLNQYRESPLIVDEHIFDKNLKPAEIFGLANLFRRKKRSIKVKKISSLRNKIKLNRYLNTKAMPTKRILLNKKRHKRQISKIRIIASDLPYKRSRDANIFLVSGENVFADRAIVKDVEGTEAVGEKVDETEYTPYQTDISESLYKEFESKSRKNNLMSKYPHIFMEEVSKSKEDTSPRHSLLFRKLPGYKRRSLYDIENENVEDEFITDASSTIQPDPDMSTEPTEKPQEIHDILEALQSPKTNYRVTVKVTPKNATKDMHQGFKEIHTSINKIYNKNGLTYSSLVNVSEISNITNFNKSENKKLEYNKATDTYLAQQFKQQHEKMQTLLKQHQKLINEQLAKLNEEKTNIESILIDDNKTVDPHFDYLDVMDPSKSQKILHLGRDVIKKMAAAILNNRKKDSLITETTTVTTTSATTPTTTTSTTTTPATTTSTTAENPLLSPVKTTMASLQSFFTEKMKKNLLHTIERNEKLTDQILRKVDKNTEILQTFLNKFTYNIEAKPPDLRNLIKTKDEITEQSIPKYDHIHPLAIDWKKHGAVPFNPNVMRKNMSHISIPFLYAYQHPIMPLKMNSPVASVVYHGTIHTNTLQAKEISAEKDKIQPSHKIPIAKNQTRFFIDEVESDYKVIPVNDINKQNIFKNVTTT